MSRRKQGSPLTDKEKMFCQEFIIDLDATQAAIRAGYSEESAKTIAYHVRQRPEVDAYINDLLERRKLRLRITADDVLIELAKIAFAEPVDFNEDSKPEEAPDIVNAGNPEEETARTLIPSSSRYSSATMYRVTDIDADTGRRSVRYFSLPAKIAALRLLGRHLGLFGTNGKSMPAKPNIIFPPKRHVLLSSQTA